MSKICPLRGYGRTPSLQVEEAKFFNNIRELCEISCVLGPVGGDPVLDRLALRGLKLLWQSGGIHPKGLQGKEPLLLCPVAGQTRGGIGLLSVHVSTHGIFDKLLPESQREVLRDIAGGGVIADRGDRCGHE